MKPPSEGVELSTTDLADTKGSIMIAPDIPDDVRAAAEAAYPESEWSQPATMLAFREAYISGRMDERDETPPPGLVQMLQRVMLDRLRAERGALAAVIARALELYQPDPSLGLGRSRWRSADEFLAAVRSVLLTADTSAVDEQASVARTMFMHVATVPDMETRARLFNEGFDAAVAQGLADNPAAAEDWLAEKLLQAKADAWDEGFARAQAMWPSGHRYTPLNPYRAAEHGNRQPSDDAP